jgi:hypothetical protein
MHCMKYGLVCRFSNVNAFGLLLITSVPMIGMDELFQPRGGLDARNVIATLFDTP